MHSFGKPARPTDGPRIHSARRLRPNLLPTGLLAICLLAVLAFVWVPPAVAQPVITVTVTPSTSSIPHSGEPVTLTVRIENLGAQPVTLTALTADLPAPDLAAGCPLPQGINSGGSFHECSFEHSFTCFGESITITATVVDGANATATASGSATVSIEADEFPVAFPEEFSAVQVQFVSAEADAIFARRFLNVPGQQQRFDAVETDPTSGRPRFGDRLTILFLPLSDVRAIVTYVDDVPTACSVTTSSDVVMPFHVATCARRRDPASGPVLLGSTLPVSELIENSGSGTKDILAVELGGEFVPVRLVISDTSIIVNEYRDVRLKTSPEDFEPPAICGLPAVTTTTAIAQP